MGLRNMTTPKTLNSRITRIQDTLKERGYSGALFSSAVSIRYLTGFTGLSPEEHEVLLVVLPNRIVLCCPMMYEELAQGLAVVKNGMVAISVDTQLQGLLKGAVEILNSVGAKRVATEEDHLNVSEMKKLQSLVQGEFANISGVVEGMRRLK